jgi:RNA polymerase sigma-70 factor (ECF subfamily)
MPQSRTAQFDALVAPHIAMLFSVAYRLVRNTHDAQDLVQDACLAAYEHPLEVGAAAHPERWLLRVLHNRFIDAARRNQRGPFVAVEITDSACELASDAPGPEELLQQADSERQFEQAFLALDAPQRTVLTLRAEGYDLADIEAITGIGREVLRARLHRARRTFALRLIQHIGADTQPVRAGSNQ